MFTPASDFFTFFSIATLRPVLKLVTPCVLFIIKTVLEVVSALTNFVLIARHPVLVSSNGIAVIRAVDVCDDLALLTFFFFLFFFLFLFLFFCFLFVGIAVIRAVCTTGN